MGQLITIQGEQNSAMSASNYCFKCGDTANSGANFGYMVPCSVKLKKFVYASSQTGTAFTTSTKIIFQLYVDGSSQLCYAYCDFSNTTNGNVTNRRFCNKFSSSSIVQIDYEPSFSNAYGQSLSWYCISTNVNSDNNKHRFNVILETTENL